MVELIVFIAVVGTAVAGVLAALTSATRSSGDALVRKQALAIAEAVLEEIQLQPFTYCDPDDSQAATALSATVGASGCNATVEVIGVEGGETRSGSPVGTPPIFDNVSDYDGYDSSIATPSGITFIDGTSITGLDSYRVIVAVGGQPLETIGDDANSRPQSLLITVTVTGLASTSVTLHGYRVRYVPNALP